MFGIRAIIFVFLLANKIGWGILLCLFGKNILYQQIHPKRKLLKVFWLIGEVGTRLYLNKFVAWEFTFRTVSYDHSLAVISRGMPDWKVNNQIRTMANDAYQDLSSPCLYQFVEQNNEPCIEIHPLWVEYLQSNWTIVAGYCFWNLTNYLQKNNPNVPNIAGKLFEPMQRSLQTARQFWRIALNQMGNCRCIYSGMVIDAR